jgi:hypothetical protein
LAQKRNTDGRSEYLVEACWTIVGNKFKNAAVKLGLWNSPRRDVLTERKFVCFLVYFVLDWKTYRAVVAQDTGSKARLSDVFFMAPSCVEVSVLC